MQSLETNSVTPQIVNSKPENAPGKGDLKNSIILLLGVLIVVVLIILAIVAVALLNQNKKDDFNSNTPAPQTSIKPSIEIISPTENSELNGKVSLIGKATGSLNKLNIKLFDGNNNLLAQSTASLTGQSITDWTSQLDVIASPETMSGKLTITPESSDFEYLAKTEVVNFEQRTDRNERVKIYSPLLNQVMTGNDILFRGQMKGFFEGTMNIRLKDADGTIIHEDTITAENNYDKFVDFSKLITVADLSKAKGKTGTWEFYETSAKDGSATVLYSLQVGFR